MESKAVDLQLQIQNVSSVNARLMATENDLRGQLENSKTRIVAQENHIRTFNEETYKLKSEIKDLQTDLINMVSVEESLRKDLSQSLLRSKEVEESLSHLKSQACQDAIRIRHLESDNEGYKREIRNLEEALERVKIEDRDIRKEVENFRDKAFNMEKQNIYLRDALDNQEDKYRQAVKELDRTKGLLKAQRELSRGPENRHRSQIREEPEEEEVDYLERSSYHKPKDLSIPCSPTTIRENKENTPHNLIHDSQTTRHAHSISLTSATHPTFTKRNNSTFESFQNLGFTHQNPSKGHTRSFINLPNQPAQSDF